MSDLVPESVLQEKAFEDYLALGPERSAMGLHRKYKELRREDPTALVPAHDLNTLLQWETDLDWKVKALEYDGEAYKIWQRNRIKQLERAFNQQLNLGSKLIRKGKRALRGLNTADMNAQDVMKFLVEGNKMAMAAIEKIEQLKDPSEGRAAGGAGDFYETLRRLSQSGGNINVTQNNITVNGPLDADGFPYT